MEFQVLPRNSWVPNSGKETVYLKVDYWNDYSFVTMFYMSLHDENGQFYDIGAVKIGFKGQTTETDTYAKLPDCFESLGDDFFSLGQDVDFYRNLAALPNRFGKKVLMALRDIVLQPDLIEDVREERVFGTSLLRSVSLSVVRGQYARVLEGKAELTDFKFKFTRPEAADLASIYLHKFENLFSSFLFFTFTLCHSKGCASAL